MGKRRSFILLVALSCLSTACFKSHPPKVEFQNTLRLPVMLAKIKGLDPAFSEDIATANEVGRVYESLFQYHYLKRPYVLIPALAEALPIVSADGKTYTIKIKKGVLFQDDPCFKATEGRGRELIADDVVYSLKRLADPTLMSSGWWLLDGKIEGLNAWRDAASKTGTADYQQPVAGLKVLDRYTVQIQLTRRSSQFLYALAMPFTGIVPSEAVEKYQKDFSTHPVGTGPFHLEEYRPSTRLVWTRNPTYRQETYPSEGAPGDREAGLLNDAGKRLPLVDRLVVEIYSESSPAWLNFLSGKLDVMGIPKENYSQAIAPNKDLSPELKAKGIRLLTGPQVDVTHVSFNMADPLLGKNKLLRQAISIGYNQEPLTELFYNGRAVIAQGPIPPGLEGYDPNLKNPYRQYSQLRAKELLAKAGYAEGKNLPPLELAIIPDATARQMAEYQETSLGALGIKLKISVYSWPEFISAIKNKKAQIWNLAWKADYPDAENFLQLFYSKNMTPGPNDSNYSNPEYDRLYEKAMNLPHGPERTALYKQMVKIVVEDCPWIFGVHRVNTTLAQPWLKNFKIHDFDHGTTAKYLRTEQRK
jgi:ABC-type transport system substrate-binding protein